MLAIRIALRYLFSKKSHTAVNIISYVSIAGVALATAAMVIVLSVFNGFANLTATKLSRLSPDLMVSPVKGATIADADQLCVTIGAIEGVAEAAATVEQRAFAVADDRQMPLTVKGVDPGGPSSKALSHLIIDGSDELFSAEGLTTAISSVGVANTLHAYPSYPIDVKIYEPRRRGRINPANPMGSFKCDSVVVTGVYRVEQAEYDADMLIVPLATARQLLDYDTEATSIEVSLLAGSDTGKVAVQIAAAVGPDYRVADRVRQHETSFRMIEIEKWVTLLMLAFILVIASFNILSTMSMLIVEKRDNRRIMLAMGATPGMIATMYGWLSGLITAIGAIGGMILGTAVSLAQEWGGFVKIAASDMSTMSIDVYPVAVEGIDLLIVGVVALAIGIMAAAVTRLVAGGEDQ